MALAAWGEQWQRCARNAGRCMGRALSEGYPLGKCGQGFRPGVWRAMQALHVAAWGSRGGCGLSCSWAGVMVPCLARALSLMRWQCRSLIIKHDPRLTTCVWSRDGWDVVFYGPF
jgi:hypothetical protein